ncbi:MAG: hypothetical protein QGG71_17545 [Pirellulaceae bacterium]|nr:hypothetical protein [Pirellulaceae bacterium]
MSDDSAPDNATDPRDVPESMPAPIPESPAGEAPKRSRLRLTILLCLLGLGLLGLAYDRQVARPNVSKAYDQIVQLNDQMNTSANAKPTMNTDIHKEINRAPRRTYTDGPYRIEVFSWTAGLPFRTHDLFAVYVPKGNDLVFMRHYKFALPDDELNPPAAPRSGDGGDESEGMEGAPTPEGMMEMPIGGGRGGPGRGGEGGGEGRRQRPSGDRPQRPSGDGEDENPGAEEGSPIPPESAGDAAPASTPPDDAAPDASAPEARAVPAETPADTQPAAESEAAPAAPEAKKKDA